MSLEETATVAVVGLGYVGLSLASALGRRFDTIGIDRDERRIAECRRFHDATGQVAEAELRAATHLRLVTDPAAIAGADVVIVAVPTPVDGDRQPDLGPLLAACRCVGPHLKAGATVVFESTVYPGATEEACIPALEHASGRRWKEGFFVGYSPERINPGDAEHTLASVVKVVAGDTPATLERLAGLYAAVVPAGIHRAPSIRVAEAAKVIENTQRDLNIALMNELAIAFHRMGLDTGEVLAAARTKWNFLDFVPGLVGGHCIGVDPWYLTHATAKAGHQAEVILAGRRINDGMGRYVAREVAARVGLVGATVVVLGLAYKEDCADVRNSRVADLVRDLEAAGARVAVHDPRAGSEDALREHGVTLVPWGELPRAEAVVLAVRHGGYLAMALGELLARLSPGGWVFDVKGALDRARVEAMGFRYWRL
jgi:UDP-N-acetyl-D-galactosamine dehydrogenase